MVQNGDRREWTVQLDQHHNHHPAKLSSLVRKDWAERSDCLIERGDWRGGVRGGEWNIYLCLLLFSLATIPVLWCHRLSVVYSSVQWCTVVYTGQDWGLYRPVIASGPGETRSQSAGGEWDSETCRQIMGPQPRQISHRFSIISDLDTLTAAAKERLMSGSGSVSGSPGRLQDNISRDSGIGCLKVSIATNLIIICMLVHQGSSVLSYNLYINQ